MIELCCEYLSVRYIWLYVIIMSRRRFRGNLHSLVAWMSRNSLLGQNRRNIWSLSISGGIRTHNYLVRKRILNHLAKLVKWLSCVVSAHLYGAFDCMFLPCHVCVSEWIHTNLASLAKLLSVRLWTKWLWVWVQLQFLKLQISLLLRARFSLAFKQL